MAHDAQRRSEPGPSPGQRYAFEYDSPVTHQFHASRTASTNAAFFLPYLKPGLSLLDCGCGSGSITLGLAEAVAPGPVVGIDVGPTVIEAARQSAAQSKLSDVSFRTADVYQLPFADATFDAVFTHNMPEHLSDPLKAFREMQRVLKPGGVIGARDGDTDGYLLCGASEAVVREAIAVWTEDWKNVSGDPYIGKRLRALLREAGFVRIKAGASYDVYPTPEALAWITEIVGSRYEEEQFIERAIAHGLADREEMQTYANAWRELGRDPDGFFANAHGEAVGWKE